MDRLNIDRLQHAIEVAKIITKGFFSEVVAQFSFAKSSVIVEEKMTLSELKEKISKDALNAGEAMAHGVDHEFEITKVTKMIPVGDCYVYLRLYKDRVERIIKKPRGKYSWERADSGQSFERASLRDYTPEMAKEAKLDFSMAGAIAFTNREFDGTAIGNVALKEKNSAPEADFLSGVTPPQKGGINSKNQQANKDPGVVKITKGEVIFADKAVIKPEGRGAYNTFTVILKTADGLDVQYSGVELEKLFLAGKFSVGDDVVLKKGVETFSKELGGVTKNGVRNTYQIEII